MSCDPVPITTLNMCRFAAFLGRTRSYSTVNQYLNILRILHLEMGYPNPLKDNYALKTVLTGMKRGKGAGQSFKLPLSTADLLRIRSHLNLALRDDLQFWAAIITCFFGLFRIRTLLLQVSKKDKILKLSGGVIMS